MIVFAIHIFLKLLSELYLVETYRHNFIIKAHAHGSHEYANEANDDDVPKPTQSLGTPVPRQKGGRE